MKINQIICKAASVYPDGCILNYWNKGKKCPKKNHDGGDTLAQFIAHELADTYDPKADDSVQVETAIRVMQAAVSDITAVIEALRSMQQKGMPCEPMK